MTYKCKMCGLEFETGIVYFTVCEGCCDKIDSKEMLKRKVVGGRRVIYKNHGVKLTHMFRDARRGYNYTQCGVILKEESTYLKKEWHLIECKKCLMYEPRVRK